MINRESQKLLRALEVAHERLKGAEIIRLIMKDGSVNGTD